MRLARFLLGMVATVSLLAFGGAETSLTQPEGQAGEWSKSTEAAQSSKDQYHQLLALAQPNTFRVALPNDHNLQWLNFWVAQGAGYFNDENLDVQIVVPPMPAAAGRFMVRGKAEAAILPRPLLFEAISSGEPIVAIANLLENDPVNLVLDKQTAERLKIGADTPLSERLEALRGLKIGVAPGPLPRLRVLFESVGLDADSHVELVMLNGTAQNQTLGNGGVAALYTHTPYLETALTDQQAVLLVNQSAGEVLALADRQIQSVVTSRDNLASRPDELGAFVRALYRAQKLIASDPEATLRAVLASEARLEAPAALEVLIAVYASAVPSTPQVFSERLAKELLLLPSHRPPPDLSGIDLQDHVDNRFALEAVGGGE